MDSRNSRNSTAKRQKPGAPTRHDGDTLTDAVDKWATATVDDANNITRASGQIASLARDTFNWATPTAEDGDRAASLSNYDGLSEDVLKWATPMAAEAHTRPQTFARGNENTAIQAEKWASPDAGAFNVATTREAHAAAMAAMAAKKYNGNGAGETLGIMVNSFDPGPTPSPSAAPTEPSGSSRAKPLKRGLNHRFGLWLMGYPAEWLDCAPSATRGAPKRRARRSE